MKTFALRPLGAGVAASFCLAILTCFVSNNLHPRFEHREETIQQQLKIVEGQDYLVEGSPAYFPEFQNRVLPGLALKAAGQVGGLRIGQWYLILRFASGCLAFFLFFLMMTQTAGVPTKHAIAGMGILAYAKIFSYNHGWEHPTDFPDIIFMTGYLWAALGKRYFSIVVLMVIASFNRESSPFAGVVWFFLHGITDKWRPNFRQAAFGVALSVGALATVYAIRYGFGGARAVTLQTRGILWIAAMVASSLKNPLHGWLTLLIALMIPFAGWIGSNWSRMPNEWRRLTLAGAVVAVISGSLSVIQELRTFLPALTVLACVAVKSEAGAGGAVVLLHNEDLNFGRRKAG